MIHTEDNKIIDLYETKSERRTVFFFVSLGLFTITYGLFWAIDFLPEPPQEESGEVVAEETIVEDALDIHEETPSGTKNFFIEDRAPLPLKIVFDSLNREVSVLNPTSRNIADLDNALLSGVVRHPDSADFGQKGTIFLFGHSSYLPNVLNKNFQAFNGVQNLQWGDIVRLQSEDMEYVYRVDRVYKVEASAASVTIERGVEKLTLMTCNSFGSKDDRFIVEATLIDSYVL